MTYAEQKKYVSKTETKRVFASGANRDLDTNKHDYEGFLSPLALEAFGEYMTKHRKLPDGTLRDSDNWQKGIPLASYMKSLLRHAVALWKIHRGYYEKDGVDEALGGIVFNAMGYWHELRAREQGFYMETQALKGIGPWPGDPDYRAGGQPVREQMDPVSFPHERGEHPCCIGDGRVEEWSGP